jgi:ribosomal protein S11
VGLEVPKSTPYAAQMAAEDCSKVALEAGLKRKLKVSLC